MKARLLCAAALAVAAGLCGPASATIVNAEWTGTITAGFDALGIFGAVGADVSGLAFTADFLYDTSLGTTLFSSPTGTWVEGGLGTSSGGQSPISKASFTLNGVTSTFVPDLVGQILAANGQPNIVNEIFHNAESSANEQILLDMTNSSNQISGSIPGTIDVPLTYTLGPNDIAGGNALFGGGPDSFELSPVTVTYTIPSTDGGGGVPGAPEPSTWAMMLLGFAGLGYAGFKRRPKARLA
jgi:hypothetical protein